MEYAFYFKKLSCAELGKIVGVDVLEIRRHKELENPPSIQVVTDRNLTKEEMSKLQNYLSGDIDFIFGKLSVDRWTIPADNETPAVIHYTSNNLVNFVVDGATVPVTPENGTAVLEITATDPGPIDIKIEGVERVITITAEEVA